MLCVLTLAHAALSRRRSILDLLIWNTLFDGALAHEHPLSRGLIRLSPLQAQFVLAQRILLLELQLLLVEAEFRHFHATSV